MFFLSEDVANRQLEFELSLWLNTLIDQERNVGAIQTTKDRFSEVSSWSLMLPKADMRSTFEPLG